MLFIHFRHLAITMTMPQITFEQLIMVPATAIGHNLSLHVSVSADDTFLTAGKLKFAVTDYAGSDTNWKAGIAASTNRSVDPIFNTPKSGFGKGVMMASMLGKVSCKALFDMIVEIGAGQGSRDTKFQRV
jgi:hypothetical protein